MVHDNRSRSWIWASLIAAAMLALPVVAWFSIPAPPPPARAVSSAPREGASAAATTTAASEGPSLPRPRPRPASDDADEDLADPDEAPVRGIVRDAAGNPVEGALVRCVDDASIQGITDAEGRFELPPDGGACRAIAIGGGASSRPTELRAGADNVLELQKGGAIAGIVVDETGTGVVGYTLAIETFLPPGGEGPGPAVSRRRFDDPSGAFTWEDLPPGRYVLSASVEGRPPARSELVEVEGGRTTHHVRITLAGGATLRGVVTDSVSRKPVAGAVVALDSIAANVRGLSPATTDPSGEFVLEGVPKTGPFSVRVTHADYRSKIVSGLDARGSSSLTERIALTPREEGGADSELAGIGAMLNGSPRGVVVAGLVDGGPAARAGLRAGDVIVRIDGVDATTMTLSECVQRLRGPEGSRVDVQVSRAGAGNVDISIVRELVVR